MKVIAAARRSPLSKAQTSEVLNELTGHHPHITFEMLYIDSKGDKDLLTSLRGLEKTNFFTYELDEALLQGQCDIAIHSAKDLPEPLPEGLVLAAVTKGIADGDLLIMKEGYTLDSLPSGAIIATSSERREEAIKALRNDLSFIDLRGNIGQRLERLKGDNVYGVVVAEAAIIRLKLLHLNCMPIPGPTVPLQGKLAIVTREDNFQMRELFTCLDQAGKH